MKAYKVRCTKHTKQWIKIESSDARDAAADYADEGYANQGDIVTVLGVGRFEIHELPPQYEACRIK